MQHLANVLRGYHDKARQEVQDNLPGLWERGKDRSVWLEYNGPDCAAFKAYIRFAHDKIVYANIIGLANDGAPPSRRGRMPVLIAAALAVSPRVVIESVINSELEMFLLANDFVDMSPEEPHTFYKDRDNGEAPA
jgi:hypothetical protein